MDSSRMRAAAAVAMVLSAFVAAQEPASDPVRVSIEYLVDPGSPDALPRLLPTGSAPLLALGPHARTREFHRRMPDFLTVLSWSRFPGKKPPRIESDGTDLVVEPGDLPRDDVEAWLVDGLALFAPRIELGVAVHRSGPTPPPVAIPAADASRYLLGEPLYELEAARASDHAIAAELTGPGGERARVRIEPHLLTPPDKIALLCEFEIERTSDGVRHRSAGTASGVVPVGGVLLLSLPDRVLAVRADHRPHHEPGRASLPWSLLTSGGLFTELELLEGESPRAHRANDGSRLRAVEQFWWMRLAHDLRGRITIDQGGWQGLVTAKPADLREAMPKLTAQLAELHAPWIENGIVDLVRTPDGEPTRIVRLPTLPGRLACLAHGTWPVENAEPRVDLVALRWQLTDASVRDDDVVSGFAATLPAAGEGAARFPATRFDEEHRVVVVSSARLELELTREP